MFRATKTQQIVAFLIIQYYFVLQAQVQIWYKMSVKLQKGSVYKIIWCLSSKTMFFSRTFMNSKINRKENKTYQTMPHEIIENFLCFNIKI